MNEKFDHLNDSELISRFHTLVSAAEIKYSRQNPFNLDEREIPDGSILFNHCLTARAFESDLRSLYLKVCNAIEKSSLLFQTKAEYLFYVKRWLRNFQLSQEFEFESCPNEVFRNKRVVFPEGSENLKELLEQNHFDAFFNIQWGFLQKVVDFLDSLSEEILVLHSSDIPLLTISDQLTEKEKQNKPFHFFKNLISDGGLEQLRFKFETYGRSVIAESISGNYDAENEAYSWLFIDNDSENAPGEYIRIIKFSEELDALVLKEKQRGMELFDSKVTEMINKKEDPRDFIQYTLGNLITMHEQALGEKQFARYTCIDSGLTTILREIGYYYHSFIAIEHFINYTDLLGIEYKPKFPKVHLEIPVKEFVSFFGPYIKKGMVSVNGSKDMSPVVTVLSDIFSISKGRGEGFVTPGTLQTNFKIFSSDSSGK